MVLVIHIVAGCAKDADCWPAGARTSSEPKVKKMKEP